MADEEIVIEKKSSFLYYQDKNRDGLIDVCEDLVDVEETPACLPCSPNPNALVPDWRNKTIDEPFLNEKTCEYQITVKTKYSNTAPEEIITSSEENQDAIDAEMEGRFDQYVEAAIKSLLSVYDKDDSDESKAIVQDAIEYTKFSLDPRPLSRLKLLYSVPFDVLNNLPDAEPEDEDADEDDEDAGDTTVVYMANDLKPRLIKVRKSLNLYNRYLKVYRAMEGGNVYIDESHFTAQTGANTGTKIPKVFPLDLYGDAGFFPTSLLGKTIVQLDKFLVAKNYNLPGVGGLKGSRNDRVVKMEFKFSEKFKLKRLKIWTEGCGEKPIMFNKKLDPLRSQSAWKDPTAMAYFARLEAMETDLTARTPKPWLEFIKEHTYPLVYDTTNPLDSNTDPENTIGSCIADNLAKEAKQLGQDILDDVFGIGDAIAAAFHKNLCRTSLGEVIEDDIELGKIYDPNSKTTKSLYAMAQEQAFKQLEQDDQVFMHLCARILGITTGAGEPNAAMDMIWKEGFDKIKLCGLFDLLMDAIGCLLGGMELEAALASMLKSAFQSMGVDNFGDLFIGLPPEKQQELDALVQKKLESGDVFKEGSVNQQTSDTIAGTLEWTKPWEALSEDVTEAEKEKMTSEQKKAARKAARTERQNKRKESMAETMTASEMQETSESSRKTLSQQFDVGSEENQSKLSPNVLMEAYFLAILEIYQDNLLDLLDKLNSFPGAPIVSKLLAMLDCPRPPLFNPSFMDFIKDIELPFCRNMNDITLPRLENPFGWLPKIKDIIAILWYVMKIEINKLIMKILMKLLVKICELIGNALCKALEATGAMAMALAGGQGRDGVATIIKNAICGEDADKEQVEDTIIDLFDSLGNGASSLADRDQILGMAEDLSSGTTQTEMMSAFLGDPSQEFLDIFETIIEYEYPDLQDAFPNQDKIGNFCANVGNLMPLDFKEQMQNAVDNPAGPPMPANPSLCATPEQIEDFKNLRCQLLSGRATKEQCNKMFDELPTAQDLDDLGAILQKGIPNYLSDNMPPLVSDPGCDNGLIPFESEEQKAVVSAALGGDLEQLKIAFSFDILGNGPGEKKWGLINMVLSDTMGMPYTAHQRRVFNRKKWVDFYIDESDTPDFEAETRVANVMKQKGAYPQEVAGHLRDELTALDTTFISTNDYQDDKPYKKSFDSLNIGKHGKSIDLLTLPDLGYNYETLVDYEAENIVFVEKARKETADASLSFRDNAKGDTDQDFSFGFDMEFFLSDLMLTTGSYAAQRPGDNARIKITNKFNANADLDFSTLPFMTGAERRDMKKEAKDAGIISELKFEFLTVDDTLDGADLDSYTEFLSTFESKSSYMPQIILLKEILNDNGASLSNSEIKTFHDTFMSSIFSTFATEIAENEAAFTYGAVFDGLVKEDVEYVNEDGEDYHDATNEDGDPITNSDMILGVSRMQYEVDNGQRDDENRVFYLDPAQYGGSYMNPPLYIAPLPNEGWLGFVDVMFPEISPCKPQRTDLIDFEDIQSRIDEIYPSLPEDERLKSDPDCIKELPYERILERSSVAAIEGLITAAIRIFVSVHFIKAIATFTKFYPKFTETYSSLFAQYIVEDMERHFKSAQKAGWEFFNPFKDSEFWYAFLEQSVQTYARRVDSEGITPPTSTYDALANLSRKVKKYDYPYRPDLQEAKGLTAGLAAAAAVTVATGGVAAGAAAAVGTAAANAATEGGRVSLFTTLKGYRSTLNLEAVQETEEDAKLVLKELVNEQLNYMGEKFIENLEIVGMTPDVFDLDYYVFENLTQGSSLTLGQDIKEEVVNLPTEESEETEELYTAGSEFSNTETGEMYTGYYHVTTDENGDTTYMAGEFHTEEAHATLRPLANQVIVPIGDVEDYGYEPEDNEEQPFLIEKYISINGTKYSSDDAIDIIMGNDGTLLLSDVYPGTLEHVLNEAGGVVGLTGELGVRYGLQFSVVIGGEAHPATTVEVDALDLAINQTPPFEGESKLLLCLINMLKNDSVYKLVAQYVFPMKKMLATLAIYNSEAFLPSIGEITVAEDAAYGAEASDIDGKPGMKVVIDDDGNLTTEATAEGWANVKDRASSPFNFVREWDNWDQVLLRKSKSRLKKLFKPHYNSREFDPGDDKTDSPGKILLNSLRESFKFPAGMQLLPWWKRRLVRPNPFNSKGELCEKED